MMKKIVFIAISLLLSNVITAQNEFSLTIDEDSTQLIVEPRFIFTVGDSLPSKEAEAFEKCKETFKTGDIVLFILLQRDSLVKPLFQLIPSTGMFPISNGLHNGALMIVPSEYHSEWQKLGFFKYNLTIPGCNSHGFAGFKVPAGVILEQPTVKKG